MTTRPKLFIAASILIASVFMAACGGGDDANFPETTIIKNGVYDAIIANSEIVVGPNRFILGVLTPEGAPLVDANVNLTFYELNGGNQVERFKTEAISRVPARDAGITEQVEHIHTDGTRHTHFNVGEEVGVYTANVTFDRPGDWGVKVDVRKDNPKVSTTLLPRFNVLERALTPGIGQPAPRSRNLTAADVSDITQIDSSTNPSVDMHTATIADTIAAGKPALVLFAVPGFCSSRLCGPEIEIMRKLFPTYKDKVEFIHVEFYKDPGSAQRIPVDTVGEWNLRSEPWFFLIDAQGNIAAKYEGPTSMQELQEALELVGR